MSKVVVVGQGYVGLPMALAASGAGHVVTGFDSNQGLVDRLNAGKSHIDDVSDQVLAEGLSSSYRASADPDAISDADVILVCVPTPLTADGGPDLAAVESAAETVGRYVRTGALVILESTTYPGTTEEIFAPLVNPQLRRPGSEIFIAFSPERIDPGNRAYTIRNTPKVVGGLTAACTAAAKAFYESFIDEVVAAKGAIEAEMSKLLENTFRHVNIALVNEMLRFSRDLNVDIWDAVECAATKPFGFMSFKPGPGVGGHCIPVDPSYLSHRVRARLGYAFRMVELAEEINGAAPLYVANRLAELLNRDKIAVNGARVLLIGVSYKPNIADCRETPAVPLAKRLVSLGADVEYHDPLVDSWPGGTSVSEQVKRVHDVYEGAAAADVSVLLQAHSHYDLSRLALESRRLLDTRGVVPREAAVEWL